MPADCGYGRGRLVRLAAMRDTEGHAAPARILVVDDDASIRLLCRVNFELEGHEVLEAESLATARARLADARVDVVVLDVHLRGERSDALVGECHARRPPIPVVLVTGSVDITHPGLVEADAILPKPFELEALLSTVRDLARARPRMSAAAVRSPQDYEDAYEAYYAEAAEELRAVRVGEKGTSEQAAIVSRHADLFSQGNSRRCARPRQTASDADERERLYRLRRTCEAGIVDAELAAHEDAARERAPRGSAHLRRRRAPLRTAEARLAVLREYAKREELGDLARALDASFNERRRELLVARNELEAALSGERDAVARNEAEKQISLRELENVLRRAADDVAAEYGRLRDHWFERMLGPERASAVERSRPLAAAPVAARVDLSEGAVGRGVRRNRPRARVRARGDPEHPPRPRGPAAEEPTRLRDRGRSAGDRPPDHARAGGLSDYQSFLHEAGHALHYAGCDPQLPWTFRALSRDHALTEIYSYIVEAVSRQPGWHARHFGLSDAQAEENAEATRFLEAFLFRRYAAKLRYELGFWDAFADERGGSSRDYEPLLTDATGLRYDERGYLSDMDAGFYSADYLRAWIRSAQLGAYLRREVGEDWWRSARHGRAPARALRRGDAALDRGCRAAARLRPARHRRHSSRS